MEFTDTLGVIKHNSVVGIGELEKFQKYLNFCHSTIKFTMKIPDESIVFLDDRLQDLNGRLWTNPYCKLTTVIRISTTKR